METKKILRNTVSLSPSWLQKFFFKESLDVTFFKCFVMFALFGTDVSCGSCLSLHIFGRRSQVVLRPSNKANISKKVFTIILINFNIN